MGLKKSVNQWCPLDGCLGQIKGVVPCDKCGFHPKFLEKSSPKKKSR